MVKENKTRKGGESAKSEARERGGQSEVTRTRGFGSAQEESEVKISEGRGIPRTREDNRTKSKRLTRQEVETLEFFAKVAITIVKKVRPREEQQGVSSKDRECEKRVDFEVGEERNEDGKSGALMLRPDLEEMSKSHRERRD
ncbi:hypothetical protein EDB83DRAFT_2309397 [Lactarius deliciosus]|nr:hypothetical protein EDB83DRAFT_2309397 [Lactarius deliciosus]